ncbi:MAG: chorismate mutase [Pseudomonadota bacterium]
MTIYTSEPRNNTSDTCQTMADVRYEIDRIDQLLVAILSERVSYMNAAARIKGDRDLVRDEARIEEVVSKVLAAAKTAGLPASVAEPVWRTLIEHCIAYEFDAFDALRSSDSAS